jgi:hypothetical protein
MLFLYTHPHVTDENSEGSRVAGSDGFGVPRIKQGRGGVPRPCL